MNYILYLQPGGKTYNSSDDLRLQMLAMQQRSNELEKEYGLSDEEIANINSRRMSRAVAKTPPSQEISRPFLYINPQTGEESLTTVPMTGNAALKTVSPEFAALTLGSGPARSMFGTVASKVGKAIAAFKTAHPFISTGIDLGLTGLGIYDAASDNGLRKTYRFLKDGRYGKAALSGVGDALNIWGGVNTYKLIKNIANPAYRSAWAYMTIPQHHYRNTIGRAKNWIAGMLTGKPPDVAKEAKWVDALRKELDKLNLKVLPGLWNKNKDAAIEIFARGRDEASRLYNRLPSRHGYYIKNPDGSYSYNLKKIVQDWHDLTGETTFPIHPYNFYPTCIKPGSCHGVDMITGAGGNLTGNKINKIIGHYYGPTYSEELGILLIQDWQDAHPFIRADRQFSNLLQEMIDKNMGKVRNRADSIYTSIYNKLNKGDWGLSSMGKIWYNWLGGKQLNQLRYAKTPRLPGYHYDEATLEWVPGKFWQKINSKMANFEVGDVTGAKPFLMKTEVPYILRTEINPQGEIERNMMLLLSATNN